MAIEIVNRQRLARINRRAITELARSLLAAVSREAASLTIAFVREGRVRELNRTYRGKDRPTDVLSFPSESQKQKSKRNSTRASFSGEDDEAAFLGDVVVSTDTALGQAREAGHSFDREVGELVIHGVLHLCGYDHETDRGEMNTLELKLRRKLLD